MVVRHGHNIKYSNTHFCEWAKTGNIQYFTQLAFIMQIIIEVGNYTLFIPAVTSTAVIEQLSIPICQKYIRDTYIQQ